MTEIDRSTIEGLRLGDNRAYELVIDELHVPVYRFLLRLSGDPGAAEDLTQETFLAVWQGIGTFQGRSKFKTWVFGIAYRQHLRLRDRKAPETLPLDDDMDAGEADDPSAAAIQSDERGKIRDAVYNLPEMFREVVCIVQLDGLSYREAADVLGIPVGTVKSRMNSAFQLLRQKLGWCEVDDDEMR